LPQPDADPGSPHHVIGQIEAALLSSDDDPLALSRRLVGGALSGLKGTTTEIINLRIKLQVGGPGAAKAAVAARRRRPAACAHT
jgi:hypothetical protein